MKDSWSALDLVEGFHLGQAIAVLHEEGILAELEQPRTAEQLALERKLDAGILLCVLQYAAARTDLLEQNGSVFHLTPNYGEQAVFLLEQYVGAYGGNARGLSRVLRDPRCAAELVNRGHHARAFAAQQSPGVALLRDLALQLGLHRLVDLGCGAGALLLGLAERDPAFEGWGVDVNRVLCEEAQKAINERGLGERIRIVAGDASDPASVLPAETVARAEAVSAASLANEFFYDGDISVIAWLRRLRACFPERVLLLSDYYGCLGRSAPPWRRRTLLHDFVQVISGQGVPPPDRVGWEAIYERAGCLLVHVVEDERRSFFGHIVRLQP